jgi:hypothetical protein
LPANRIFVEFPKSPTCLENTIAKEKKKGMRGVTLCSLEISDILERDLWEFVKPEEDTSSSTLSVVLPNLRDIDTIDTIRKFKTKALLINKLSIKYQIVKSSKKYWSILKKCFEVFNKCKEPTNLQ